ncbi:MAG: EcsC family protein [Clostridia bacterium]|nr:EcsC family protein [Clostridia bacterium]
MSGIDPKKPAGKYFNELLKKTGDTFSSLTQQAGDAIGNSTEKVNEVLSHGKDALVNVIDINGSGEIDIEDFIILGLRIPGVAINRESFLRAELQTKFANTIIDKAVKTTPASAGITIEQVSSIADSVINYERNCVSGISAALGMPGGVAMAATIPADIIQYYGYMLRAIQKLLYLYGFPQIDVSEKKQVFDSETLNIMTLCLGVMYGAAGANKALISIANALARGVEKQLLNAALTKGTIFPIVKNVAKWFGQKMTKQVFAGFFRKAIPVVGGLVGGTITFLSFKPCCDKLKESLQHTILSNPSEKEQDSEIIIDGNGTIE